MVSPHSPPRPLVLSVQVPAAVLPILRLPSRTTLLRTPDHPKSRDRLLLLTISRVP
jgi:hypothetical protein